MTPLPSPAGVDVGVGVDVDVDVEAIVIGGGIVGLATARALARRGDDVVLVERHPGLVRETSSHNSGVVHAGIYYPEASWKARLCADGARRLYAYCEARGVPIERTGKWILATQPDERAPLARLMRTAQRICHGTLRWVDGAELARDEPTLRAEAAILSPESGIVDVRALANALAADLRDAGGVTLFGREVVALRRSEAGWTVVVRGAHGDETIRARSVVNAAGHGADAIARMAGALWHGAPPRHALYRGDYLALTGSAPRPRRALVYPLPGAHGLGVHLTRDLGGRLRAGPDAYAVSTPSVRLDALSDAAWEEKAGDFAARLSRFLPGIQAEQLAPDQAGVRPKMIAPGAHRSDFAPLSPAAAGTPGMTHLLGIESPGLTACLSLGAWVADLP